MNSLRHIFEKWFLEILIFSQKNRFCGGNLDSIFLSENQEKSGK